MRRFLILMCLLILALPVGINIAGCSTNKGANYCNGVGYGPKVTAVAYINLEPKTTGISLAYGQTAQLGVPTAFNCKNASVSAGSYTYGSTDLSIADVSPTGAVCGGTWNRDSAGGTPNFTICSPPKQVATGSFPGGVSQMTASGSGVTSNTVAVYVHAPISSITIPTQTACVSQGKTLTDANGNTLPLSAETTVIDDQGHVINPLYVGNLSYAAVDPSIVTIDQTGVATAHNPGSTAITATLSQTTSATGYFYTCPPVSLSLKFADGSTSKEVQQGAPQPLTTIATDVNGVVLTGITVQYTSTVPTQITVGATGIVTPTFPGSAAITAICQPVTCNSSPVNQIGVLGNGKPIVSNVVQVTTPGVVSNYLWIGSPQSQTFVPVDLNSGTLGAAVKIPYYPNSMVLNQTGSNLYFGSYRELMIYNAVQNTLAKEDTNVPGVVLAVSPDNSTVVINDQVRKLLYLYSPASGGYTSFGGIGNSAAFSPDSSTLYVAGPNTLFIHSNYTGWSTYDISGNEPQGNACFAASNANNVYTQPGPPTLPYNAYCAPGIAVTVPSVAGYVGGLQTFAHGFCPDNSANRFYPPVLPPVAASTDKLASTTDGKHILGAQASPARLSDIGVTIPTGACPANTGLSIPQTLNQAVIPGIAPTNINQIVADPDSSIAFITYATNSQAAGGLLPYYLLPAQQGALGTLGSIPLVGAATAPVVGVFSPDNTLFFAGTSGDNFVHYIDVTTLTDKQQIDPKLVDGNGNPVTPVFLAVKPRPTV